MLKMKGLPATAPFAQATEALQYLQERLPPVLKHPTVGIICGSGLGGLATSVQLGPQVEANYADVPYFPISTGT